MDQPRGGALGSSGAVGCQTRLAAPESTDAVMALRARIRVGIERDRHEYRRGFIAHRGDRCAQGQPRCDAETAHRSVAFLGESRPDEVPRKRGIRGDRAGGFGQGGGSAHEVRRGESVLNVKARPVPSGEESEKLRFFEGDRGVEMPRTRKSPAKRAGFPPYGSENFAGGRWLLGSG